MIEQHKLLYLGSNGWKLHCYRSLFGIKFAHKYVKSFGYRNTSDCYSLNEAYEIEVFLDSNKNNLSYKCTDLYNKVVAEAKALLDDECVDDFDYVHQRNKLRGAIDKLEREQ